MNVALTSHGSLFRAFFLTHRSCTKQLHVDTNCAEIHQHPTCSCRLLFPNQPTHAKTLPTRISSSPVCMSFHTNWKCIASNSWLHKLVLDFSLSEDVICWWILFMPLEVENISITVKCSRNPMWFSQSQWKCYDLFPSTFQRNMQDFCHPRAAPYYACYLYSRNCIQYRLINKTAGRVWLNRCLGKSAGIASVTNDAIGFRWTWVNICRSSALFWMSSCFEHERFWWSTSWSNDSSSSVSWVKWLFWPVLQHITSLPAVSTTNSIWLIRFSNCQRVYSNEKKVETTKT